MVEIRVKGSWRSEKIPKTDIGIRKLYNENLNQPLNLTSQDVEIER